MPYDKSQRNKFKPKEPEIGFESILEEDVIIFVIGVGKIGLRAVGKMVNRISKVNCIGLQLPADDCVTSGDLPMVMLAGSRPDQYVDLERLIETIGEPDLVFLVASLDEGHDNLLLEICSAINEKSIRLILVTPEPQNGYELSHLLTDSCCNVREAVSGMILVSEKSLIPLDLNAPKVFADTAKIDYLLRHSIEKITDAIDQRFMLCLDIADIFTILLGNGIIRVGTGIATGPDRSSSAAVKAISALEQQGKGIENATRLLCNMSGSSDMTMDDYNGINRLIHESIKEDTLLKLTLTRHEEMGTNLMVTIWAVMEVVL